METQTEQQKQNPLASDDLITLGEAMYRLHMSLVTMAKTASELHQDLTTLTNGTKLILQTLESEKTKNEITDAKKPESN